MVKEEQKLTIDNLEEHQLYPYVTNRWSRRVIQPILMALVVTAFFTAVAIVVDVLAQSISIVLLAPLFFLAALESIYTTLWLNQPQRRQLNSFAYRSAELLVLVLILRAYTWIISGNYPELNLFSDYLRAPYLLVNDSIFIIGIILTIFAWVRAIAASQTFNQLAIDRAEAYYFTLPPAARDPGLKPAFSNRAYYVRALFQQWLAGGIILAILIAIIALDPVNFSTRESFLAIRQLNLPPLMILALIIYFTGGFLLLSQARLGALNARWLHNGVIKSPAVEKAWHRYTVRILLVIAIIALFLPLGSTLAIGRILQAIVVTALGLSAFLNYLIIALLALLFSPLNQELSERSPEPEPTIVIPTPEPTPIPTSTVPPDDTIQLIFSSAFWAVAIVVSIIAVGFFLRDRGVPLNFSLIKSIGTGIMKWVKSLWQDVADYAEEIRQSVQARLQTNPGDDPSGRTPWRFIRINSLSPREQIRYFYLSTVRRAKERGVPRADDETPLEYAEDLKETWPDADTEIEELTDAFLKARYSRQDFDKEAVNPIKARWKEVKQSLRRRRKSKD